MPEYQPFVTIDVWTMIFAWGNLIILFLYTDPTADLLGPVFVEELFLSNREITADNGNQGGGNVETGAESAVAVAVAAVTGAAALLVICRKK